MSEYHWIHDRRRLKRQEHREVSDLDDRLEDGFSLMQDDDDVTDNFNGSRHFSSVMDAEYEQRKRVEL